MAGPERASPEDSRAEPGYQGAGLRPFRLVKYFSFSSLVVILIFSLLLAWIVSGNARKVLFERSEAYALQLAANLNQQVLLRFVLPTVVTQGRIRLRNPEQFERLDQIVRSVTKGMRIDAVTIFDSAENVISYSTSAGQVGRRDQGGMEYQKSLKGESNSILISNGSLFNLLPGRSAVYCKLKTYIPFQQEHNSDDPGPIMGVFEIVQDLSDDLRAIIELEARIIVTSLVVMGILFTVLRYIVARAERIIEARAEERRRLENKLHEAERLAGLGKMVAAVSHEIKNPLGIIRSTAEILGKRIGKVAPGNEHLAEIIIEETTRLDGIVREFLDFARPKQPSKSMASVNVLIDKLLVFMGPEFERKGIEARRELGLLTPMVEFDGHQLHQALLNILINAVQAMDQGGVLTVRTRPALGKGLVIEISDTGAGMSAEKQEQIFIPFFTDKNRGTGLGLAITQAIIDNHDGEIQVTSREGEGATFTIVLGRGGG